MLKISAQSTEVGELPSRPIVPTKKQIREKEAEAKLHKQMTEYVRTTLHLSVDTGTYVSAVSVSQALKGSFPNAPRPLIDFVVDACTKNAPRFYKEQVDKVLNADSSFGNPRSSVSCSSAWVWSQLPKSQ